MGGELLMVAMVVTFDGGFLNGSVHAPHLSGLWKKTEPFSDPRRHMDTIIGQDYVCFVENSFDQSFEVFGCGNPAGFLVSPI